MAQRSEITVNIAWMQLRAVFFFFFLLFFPRRCHRRQWWQWRWWWRRHTTTTNSIKRNLLSPYIRLYCIHLLLFGIFVLMPMRRRRNLRLSYSFIVCHFIKFSKRRADAINEHEGLSHLLQLMLKNVTKNKNKIIMCVCVCNNEKAPHRQCFK